MASPTQQIDKLIYFPLRGRAEVIRILYKVAGKEYEDVKVTMDEWADKKKGKSYILVNRYMWGISVINKMLQFSLLIPNSFHILMKYRKFKQ